MAKTSCHVIRLNSVWPLVEVVSSCCIFSWATAARVWPTESPGHVTWPKIWWADPSPAIRAIQWLLEKHAKTIKNQQLGYLGWSWFRNDQFDVFLFCAMVKCGLRLKTRRQGHQVQVNGSWLPCMWPASPPSWAWSVVMCGCQALADGFLMF